MPDKMFKLSDKYADLLIEVWETKNTYDFLIDLFNYVARLSNLSLTPSSLSRRSPEK